MAQCCICYTTDPGYLLPTFVSATQARQLSSAENADVLIFCIGTPGEAARVMARSCAVEGIGFSVISPEDIAGADAMMARLFLDRMVPLSYSQLLYIDGDTQIVGSLDPLLTANVPAGFFMAAKDPLAFSISPSDSRQDEPGAYLRSVGVSPAQRHHYFNSGVLRINRDGWDELGREAWRLFLSMRDRSRYPDQDALNLASKGRHIPISLAWNFPIFLRNAGIEQIIKPRIVHFPGRPKPWYGGFLPWGKAGYQPYMDAVRRHPELATLTTAMPKFQRLKYHGQQYYKYIAESMAWRKGFRMQAMLNYERDLLLDHVAI